jgi:hypothetical protein
LSSGFGDLVLELPDEGTLLFATDLQGNRADYERMKRVYDDERAAGSDPFLLFAGDLVHGPSPDLNEPGAWPEHLGTPYVDESRDLVLDYLAWSRSSRTSSLMGNHEHAHVGGPRVAKFHHDEAAVLDDALGSRRAEVLDFFRSFPLIATSRCGARFTHGSPRATEADLAGFRALSYEGYADRTMNEMYGLDTLAVLLWARMASDEHARAFLDATRLDPEGEGGFVAFGHDVTREGYMKEGPHQICVSTSYGLLDEEKVYLRLDLSGRYRSVDDLREGAEILPLYPQAEGDARPTGR